MRQPLIIFVILNTSHREDTLALLASIANTTYPRTSTIVLDNRSTDGSIEAIRKSHPNVEVIELIENRGYAGNNNVGIEAALDRCADWIFILNEDTVLDPDCVSELVAAAESAEEIGVAGPMVYHFNAPDVIQSAGGMLGDSWESCHLGQNESDSGQFSAPHEVDWISGCALLARREVFEQIGKIDERFFYYWEETEWCIRAQRAGWRIMQIPAARLWHKGVQPDYKPGPSVTYYDTRNRLLLQKKHGAPLGVRLRTWIRLLKTLASWTIRPRWKMMRAHRDAMFWGMADFWRGRWGRMPSRG